MVDFVPGVNILVGKNGLGKTNLVEAVDAMTHYVNKTEKEASEQGIISMLFTGIDIARPVSDIQSDAWIMRLA